MGGSGSARLGAALFWRRELHLHANTMSNLPHECAPPTAPQPQSAFLFPGYRLECRPHRQHFGCCIAVSAWEYTPLKKQSESVAGDSPNRKTAYSVYPFRLRESQKLRRELAS